MEPMNTDYFSNEDYFYMKLAMRLAEKGRGKTDPNPMVGTVIVKGGKIISSGYHRQAGLPHAEIEAIKNSMKPLENSTMYVTLEPCTFQGKTPPCTREIIKHGFAEIVIGCVDPNPKVNGRGIKFLKDNGLKVRYGLLKDRIAIQNEVFFKHIKTGIPFVCCKIASSIDGKLATRTSDSKWITSEKSRRGVQKIRREYGCILTGINTVSKDNPYLLPRTDLNELPEKIIMPPNRSFYRVILDSKLKIGLDSNIVKTAGLTKTIIFTGRDNGQHKDKIKKLQKLNIEVLEAGADPVTKKGLDILEILKMLHSKYHIKSILLECGPSLITSFLKRNLIDKFIFYFAPKIIGSDSSYSMFKELGIDKLKDSIKIRFENVKKSGNNIIIAAYPSRQ